MVGQALGEQRDLALDLDKARVGDAGAAGVGELARLDDLCAELRGGGLVGGGEREIARKGAADQHPAGPALQTRNWASASVRICRLGPT